MIAVGSITMVLGGLRALRQHDLKLLLAYGTISQLGLMIVAFGVGLPDATSAACVLLLAHGLYKAALFMVVGVVDHQTGTRDLRRIPRLDRGWRSTLAVTVIAAASMAGVPLAFGFIAKEAVYDALMHGGFTASWLVAAVVVAGSVLTVGVQRPHGVGHRLAPHEHAATVAVEPPTWVFVAPGVVLARGHRAVRCGAVARGRADERGRPFARRDRRRRAPRHLARREPRPGVLGDHARARRGSCSSAGPTSAASSPPVPASPAARLRTRRCCAG